MSNESLNYDIVAVSKYFSKTTKRGIVLARELGEGLVTSKALLTGMLKAANEVSPQGIPVEVINRIESYTLKGLQANKYGYEDYGLLDKVDGKKLILTPAAKQALVDSRKHSQKQEVSFVAAHHVVLALLQQETVRYYLNGVCKVNAQKLERSLRGGCTLQDFED